MNPIAIIGIGCRFPQANNPPEFWQLLHDGIDAISEVPPNRWDIDSIYDREKGMPGKMNTRWGGFLTEIDGFDAEFFQISPREAERIDPQHRLLLEVTWEALENAGIIPSQLAGSSTGVFVGISNSDYGRFNNEDLSGLNAYSGVGTAFSLAANRISYFLDLKGPSLSIDTACSSSLVALHYAAQSLALGESNLCLVGGVNLILRPEVTVIFSQAQMMASDGRCKTFDAQADGYVRGEGCGVVVLKRLEEALADGDNIQAVIRGSAINQDGLTNGITAPNGPSQQAVIRQALQNAGVGPGQVSYVEAHGTGTALGDPIEIKSLKNVLMQGRSPSQPCWIGSVKTNIGHLESAAGMASLLKVILCLQHQEIPPHLHLKTLNPHISLKGTPLAIPTQPISWKVSPRLAGISAFGFGGTNCHVIVEEAPSLAASLTEPTVSASRNGQILTLSAKSEPALKELAQRYQVYLGTYPNISLEDICFSANTTRSKFEHRLGIVSQSKQQLQRQLEDFLDGQETIGLVKGKITLKKASKIAFFFTGQGSQYVGMGKQLYHTSPLFRQILDRCAAILDDYLEKPLLEVIFEQESLLNQTAYTQPALFSLEYALAQLWQSWGIKPSIVIGHSVGEYVAACVAGVFSLEDGLKLIAQRGNLMQGLPDSGTMVSILAQEGQVLQAIAPYGPQVGIAAINGPESVVISGNRKPLEAVSAKLESQGIKTKPLQVSHGFHSSLMQPILGEFARLARSITYRTPQIPIISNVTGQVIAEEIANPDYWCRHILEPVRFAQGMETLGKQDYQVFLEMGPKPILLGMGRRCLPELEGLWLPSLREAKEDWEQILESLSLLYIRGLNIDWQEVFKDIPYQKVTLPTYPYQRQPYWLPAQSLKPIAQEKEDNQGLFKSGQDCFYEIQWQKLTPKSSQVAQFSKRGLWLIFADYQGLGRSLAQELKKQNNFCLLVYPGDDYRWTEEDEAFQVNPYNPHDFIKLWEEIAASYPSNLAGVIHLWNLDIVATHELTPELLEKSQALGCGGVLHLIQTLAVKSWQVPPKIWIVTRGAVSVNQSIVSVAQSPVWGLGKVIGLEYPHLWGGLIDLDPYGSKEEVKRLLDKILLLSDQEKQIAFREGDGYVPRLHPVQLPITQEINLNKDGTYLITGGLGSLGLKVTAWLVEKGAKNLVLIGRSCPNAQVQQYLLELEQINQVNIAVFQADVGNLAEMKPLMEQIRATMPPLKGIVHAAGIWGYQSLAQVDFASFRRILHPKVMGSWLLHQLTQNDELDLFVNFSSIASVWGGRDQSHYASANFFQDQLAYYRRSLGLKATTINWGPWESGGMASEEMKNLLMRMGINPLQPQKALLSLTSILSFDVTQIAVAEINQILFKELYEARGKNPFLSELKSTSLSAQSLKHNHSDAHGDILEYYTKLPLYERASCIKSHLQLQIAKVFKKNSQEIDMERPLLEMGFDSLMAIELRNQINNDFQVDIPLVKFMEETSLANLSTYLDQQINELYKLGNEQNVASAIVSNNHWIEGEI